MDEDDDDFILDTEVEEDDINIDIVGPAPWHNSDTVAASFAFASNIASAAASHFANLSMLALGQSLKEWQQVEKAEFAREAAAEIVRLFADETKEGDIG